MCLFYTFGNLDKQRIVDFLCWPQSVCLPTFFKWQVWQGVWEWPRYMPKDIQRCPKTKTSKDFKAKDVLKILQSQPEEDLEGARGLWHPLFILFSKQSWPIGEVDCMIFPLSCQKIAVTNTFLGKLENWVILYFHSHESFFFHCFFVNVLLLFDC